MHWYLIDFVHTGLVISMTFECTGNFYDLYYYSIFQNRHYMKVTLIFLILHYATENKKCKNKNSTCLISPESVSGTPLVKADMFKMGFQ